MPPASSGPGTLVDRVSRILALAGGALLLALAGLVTASVVLRWLTSDGVPGDFELVQAGLAVTVFAFLPVCQLRGANIVVDSFTNRLPSRLRAGLDAVWAVAYALAAGLIGWQLAKGASDALASGTTSMVLRLPFGWAIAASSLLAGWLAVAALVSAARHLRRGGVGNRLGGGSAT